MYRISEIKLNLDEDIKVIPNKIIKKLGNPNIEIAHYEIMRESIDARHNSDIKKVYTVDFTLKKGNKIPKNKLKFVKEVEKNVYEVPKCLKKPTLRPVVVGFGPGGMFASLILAEAGLKPIIIERGEEMMDRVPTVNRFWKEGVLKENSNVQFGEGGAGTFSDGKLTTGIKDFRIRYVLRKLVDFGAPEDIMYVNKPHVGTDLLRNVVINLREYVKSLGGEFRFNTQVVDFDVRDVDANIEAVNFDGDEDDVNENIGVKDIVPNADRNGKKLCSLLLRSTKGENPELNPIEELQCENAIFAIGHSARDSFIKFKEKSLKMSPKPFSMGVRIEHPQDVIDTAQYGDVGRNLGLKVSDYKLNHRCKNGRGVYTFCMCPGGEVIIASTVKNTVVTNGMSYHNRDSGVANSGLLVDVRVEDFDDNNVLAGVEFQEKYETLAFINGGGNYKPPTVTWKEFRDKEVNPVSKSLPTFVNEAIKEAMPHLGRKLKGFDMDSAVLKGVETRSSSPVRIYRDKDELTAAFIGSGEENNCENNSENGMEKGNENIAENSRVINIEGFYPCGEGAGYAGGIMSSAVDGIKVAEAIINKISE